MNPAGGGNLAGLRISDCGLRVGVFEIFDGFYNLDGFNDLNGLSDLNYLNGYVEIAAESRSHRVFLTN